MAAVAEKAQHDPHCPWFLTGLTAPLVLQSMEVGMLTVSRTVGSISVALTGALYPRSLLYSASVQVENWLCPTVKVFSGLALISSFSLSLASKMACLNSYSSVVP